MKKGLVILPVISGILWGAAGIFVRQLGAMGMTTYTIVASRVIVAAVIMGIGIAVYDRSLLKIKIKDIWIFAAGGVFGMLGLNLFYNMAIERLTLSLAAVLINLNPLFVLILAAIFFHERITVRKTGCMLLALAGCVLTSGVLESSMAMTWTAMGIFLGALSGFFYGLYSIISKMAIGRGYHPLTVTFYCLAVLSIVLLPVTNWSMWGGIIREAPVPNILFMILHSVCASVLPYTLYTLSLNYLEAGFVSILASGEPVAAMVFGALIYKEEPTVLCIIGLVLTILALILLGRSKDAANGK